MWQQLGRFVLRYRLILLIVLGLATVLMGYYASKVRLSYEFSKAIPTDHPRYKEYQFFRSLFGDDGNMLVIGVQTAQFFDQGHFNAYAEMEKEIRQEKAVTDVLSVPAAVMLLKDSLEGKLHATKIFQVPAVNQGLLDSSVQVFRNLPFYHSVLYNPNSGAYLMGVRIDKKILNSPARSQVVAHISKATETYTRKTGVQVHLSGLPLIRTVVADRIQSEMKFFLAGSLLLSVLILLAFFRSFSTTAISLAVVLIGVIWTVATIHLCGYQITLLTALIPSLVVVIGIPNCIYFINKYHTAYVQDLNPVLSERKRSALIHMVGKMGVITLFCNITAAIGFAVFALTRSEILREFGVVAGISIMIIFVVSFILLPVVLSYLPVPGKGQLKYLQNKWIARFLNRVETWVLHHRAAVLLVTLVILLVSVLGMTRLHSVGYIVDDLPSSDKIYTDLKFFEKHFHGVMPLEILIDTKRKNGLAGSRALTVFEKVDTLSGFIASLPSMNRPLSLAEGLKFAKQAFFENDSAQYSMPNAFDGAFMTEYLKPGKSDSANTFTKMLHAFMDSSRRYTRISVNMADVGTEQLPVLLDTISRYSQQVFDTSRYKVTLTGTSISFLEGSRFIINGLKESIFWAFLLIALCMLYLFRSWKILLCSLIPNIIPLVVTAGIMGWAGVPLKPSTVLIFSVALGIAIDITIRFLVNYRQELPVYHHDVEATVRSTVNSTGLSIIYTALVLTAGFVIFCASRFGGTLALGWLTSVTLLTATITNLVLLPVLLLWIQPQSSSKRKKGINNPH